MSFDALKASDVTKKSEEVKIKIGDKEYKFQANEIGYLQRLNLATLQKSGGDSFTQLIVYSITDENGFHMTLEQARALHDDHAEAFFVAAAKVNRQEDGPKN